MLFYIYKFEFFNLKRLNKRNIGGIYSDMLFFSCYISKEGVS